MIHDLCLRVFPALLHLQDLLECRFGGSPSLPRFRVCPFLDESVAVRFEFRLALVPLVDRRFGRRPADERRTNRGHGLFQPWHPFIQQTSLDQCLAEAAESFDELVGSDDFLLDYRCLGSHAIQCRFDPQNRVSLGLVGLPGVPSLGDMPRAIDPWVFKAFLFAFLSLRRAPFVIPTAEGLLDLLA